MMASLSKKDLWHLKQASGPEAVASLLLQYSKRPLSAAGVIKDYHEQLLFYTAFPYNSKIYHAARLELERIAAKIQQAPPALYRALGGDGLPHTEIICSYSLTLTRWLLKTYGPAVCLHSSGADADTVRNILQLLCPNIEFEKTTGGHMRLAKRIQAISGMHGAYEGLQWLVTQFGNCGLPLPVQEELYRQLQVFVHWKIKNLNISRSFLKFNFTNLFYHKAFIKKVNGAAIIHKKINSPVALLPLQQQQLCDTIKTSLAFLNRETDPITYADENEVQLFNMGRGFCIALVYLQKERRLSLDSYVGYMAFKNGVPVSYGGGWIFGQRCKIGVNIYPAFRKGESAWMFCQVLRLYHQYFGVQYFTVNPYQFGRANKEGLQSGAYWFYYRLGFRSVDTAVQDLAATEWKKIASDTPYRTPLNILKKLAGCPVAYTISPSYYPMVDASYLSACISTHINQTTNASRRSAIEMGFKELKKVTAVNITDESLALLFLFINDLVESTAAERKQLVHLFALKNRGKEREYIAAVQQCNLYWRLVNYITSPGATEC